MKNKRFFTTFYLAIALILLNVHSVLAAPPLRVTINQAVGQADPTNASTINFTVVFTAVTTDFATEDVTLSGTAGATSAIVTGSGTDYNVEVTGMTVTGTVIASIAAGVAHDTSGTPNNIATTKDNTVTYDVTPPIVNFDLQSGSDFGASNSDNLTNAASPVFNAIFNETITGFASTDLSNIGSATGCVFTVGTASGSTYPVTVSSCSEGTLIVRLAADAVMDVAGNPILQTDGPVVTIDRTAPVFSSVTPVSGAFITSITTTSAVSYTLSEALASGTISMTRTGGAADSASPHICTLTGTALSIGIHNSLDLSNTTNACTVAQSLVIGAIYTFAFNGTDAAGNAAATVTSTSVNFGSTSITVIFDLQAESDTGASSTDNLTNAASLIFNATFSEAVTGFVPGSLSNAGTATGCVFSVGTPSGFTYPVTVSSCSEGTLIVRLAAGAVTNGGGSTNAQIDGPVVTIDRTAPVFSSVAPATGASITSITISSAVSYTLSEALAGGAISMTRTGGTADGASPHICTLTGTALSIGIHTSLDLSDTANACTVAQSLVNGTIYTFAFNGTDAAGNAAPTVTSTSITFTITAISVVFDLQTESDTGASSIDNLTNAASPIFVTIFDEAVTGFVAGSLSNAGTATGCVFSVGTPSGFTYPVTVSSCSEGTLIVRLAAGAVTNGGGSTNTQTDGPVVTIDRTAPLFSAVTPAAGTFITSITTSSAVSYTLSEFIVSGAISMTWTGGTADGASPHICTLIGTALFEGTHQKLDLSNTVSACAVAQSLVSGSIYTFAFSGTDAAGNTAATVTRTVVTFDNTAPIVSWIMPVGNRETYYVTNQSVQLSIQSFDDVGVSLVVFKRWDYLNHVWIEIGRVSAFPYTLTFDASVLLPAFNQINADAFDAASNVLSSYIFLYHLPVIEITKTGTGSGTVTSSPAGIDCGSTCSYGFSEDSLVTLSAAPTSPSIFTGWSGAGCSGTGICTVAMNASKSVTAEFTYLYQIWMPLMFR